MLEKRKVARKEIACEVLGYCPFDMRGFMSCLDHCGVGDDVIEEDDWSDSDPEYKLHLTQLQIEQEEQY